MCNVAYLGAIPGVRIFDAGTPNPCLSIVLKAQPHQKEKARKGMSSFRIPQSCKGSTSKARLVLILELKFPSGWGLETGSW